MAPAPSSFNATARKHFDLYDGMDDTFMGGANFSHGLHDNFGKGWKGPYDDYDHDKWLADWKRRQWWDTAKEKGMHSLTIVAGAVLAIFLLQLLQPFYFDLKAWWHKRKAAARYKRIKKDAAELDEQDMSGGEEDVRAYYYAPALTTLTHANLSQVPFMEVLSSTFSSDKYVDCAVDLGDGKPPRTCPAFVGDLDRISELPFKLQEACKRSGDNELAALSLVDLYLKGRVMLQYVSKAGELKIIGKASETSPAMLLAAKGFRVTVLPPTTR